MNKKLQRHVIDRSALPNKYPTHAHDAQFWEALGRAVATFGFLEDVLARAIFALTATTRYEEHELAGAYEAWLPTLAKALVDPLGGLIGPYESALRKHSDSEVQNFDELLQDLRKALALRNVICHGFWGAPDAAGATVPSFINRNKEVFATPINAPCLAQIQRATNELACAVIDTVTHMGWQFPGSTGPGEPVWSRQKS